jgi:hypothetical protein
MTPALVNYDERLRQAVRFFWRNRSKSVEKQRVFGRLDQGNRGAVTGGKNLDAFRDMVASVVKRFGPSDCQIHRDKTLVILPGFFRPTKQWDLLVTHRERLLAALELKSLCGPSFGNNANNRCEEALGSGYDFRKAQNEGLFGRGASPFLGYFLLIEDAVGSRSPVSARSPHFATDSVFQFSSYQTRMKILCERLVDQQLYSAAAVLSAPNSLRSGISQDLSRTSSLRYLLSRLAGHLAGEADLLGPREDPAPYFTGGLLDGDWFESIESDHREHEL